MGKGRIAVALVIVFLIGAYAGQTGALKQAEHYASSEMGKMSPGASTQSGDNLVQTSASTTTSPTEGFSATPVNDIYGAYTSNAASANAQYGGRTMDVSGSVDDVEQSSNGGYQSCIYATSGGVEYGCEYLGVVGGYIVWNWTSQAVAAKVPFNTAIAAQCNIAGLQNGNLVLNGCNLIYPSG